MKDSLEFPPSQSNCFDIYGDFQVDNWKKQNIVRCDLSAFRSEFEHIVVGHKPDIKAFVHENWFGFYCHRLAEPKFQLAFKNIVDRKLANQIKTFDGCLNIRKMRHNDKWSMHSWGIAADINAEWNCFGQKDFEMSKELVKCFEDEKFVWGGRWDACPDAMHFQYAIPD